MKWTKVFFRQELPWFSFPHMIYFSSLKILCSGDFTKLLIFFVYFLWVDFLIKRILFFVNSLQCYPNFTFSLSKYFKITQPAGPQTANLLNSQASQSVIGYLWLWNLWSDGFFQLIPLMQSIGFLRHHIRQAKLQFFNFKMK